MIECGGCGCVADRSGLMCCSSTLAVYEEKKANPSFLCYCGDVGYGLRRDKEISAVIDNKFTHE